MENPPPNYQGDLLIVDDMADNLRVLQSTLSNHGYRVRAVRNGAMALVGAKAAPPDLILLDVRMPEMDGYEVCQRLKADPQLCGTPIIFLSASDELEDKAKAFEVGGVDYITKPFQAVEVLARVKNQIMIQQLKKQVAEQNQQLETLAATPSHLSGAKQNDELAREALAAIATILEYTDRLSQNSAITPEQLAALKVIQQTGQTLLNLLNIQ
jgi:PleD family two-component response regulator